MRRALISVLVLLLLPALAWAGLSEPRGKVLAVDGGAIIERPGLPDPIVADVGFELFEGDWFATGEKGRAKLLLAGQLVVLVGPDTYVRIDNTIHNLKDRARVSFLTIKTGQARFLVRQRKNYSHTVRVAAPGFAVSASNAYFLTKVDPDTTRALVYGVGGYLRLERAGSARTVPVELPPGMLLAVESSGPFGAPQRVDQAAQRQLLAPSEVGTNYIWNNRPGSPEQLVDTIGQRTSGGGIPSAQGLMSASEGEGGADFDAFRAPGLHQNIRQEDLPRRGDPDGGPSGIDEAEGDATVRVRLKFPEQTKKDDDDD